MRALLSVARATALEGLQQPAVLLITLSCAVLTALQPIVQLHTFGDSGRLARDCGLAFLLFFGILVCALTSGGTLAADLHNGTAALAVAKPVRRLSYLLGKYAGSCAVAVTFAWCALWSVLLAERTAEAYVETANMAGEIRDVLCGSLSLAVPALALGFAALRNACGAHRFGLSFFGAMSALYPLAAILLGWFARDGSPVAFTAWNPLLDVRLFPAGALLALLLLIFCAITTALCVRLPVAPAAALSFLLLFLGFLADGFAQAGPVGAVAACLIPNVQHFWLADSMAVGASVSPSLFAVTALYAGAYAFFALALGYAGLRNRDL